MPKKLISVIIPCRDRSGLRLSACLNSLRWQDAPSASVDIILSDFGSSPSHQSSLRDLSDQYDCRLVRTDTDELWNRSKALNIGIQNAQTDYVLCTDVDILFAPDFLSTVIAELSNGKKLVVCRCRDLPQNVSVQNWEKTDFPGLVLQSTFRKFPGTGACQATRRDWLIGVRGYDEGYVFWGYEDRDMVWRARRAGLDVTWIHDSTSMLHQWHRKMDNDHRLLLYKNKLRYFTTGFVLRKNRDGWGVWNG